MSRRRRLRDGSRLVAARIGVAPAGETQPGDVEIRVFFYDVSPDGEMHPTNAEVAYEWLTAERDWSDRTPKYLLATYVRPRRPRNADVRLRYGGFIVQAYTNGQLQDQRSEPEHILAALRERSITSRTSPPAISPGTTPATAPVDPVRPRERAFTPPPTSTGVPVVPRQTAIPSPAASAASASSAPFGKPAPGKPGFVYSPDNEKFIIDVRGIPPGTEITDPYTGKPIRVP